jgi:hypothetical protein
MELEEDVIAISAKTARERRQGLAITTRAVASTIPPKHAKSSELITIASQYLLHTPKLLYQAPYN